MTLPPKGTPQRATSSATGLAPRTAVLLGERGIDAIRVSTVGLAQADDTEILDAALRSGRVCVTLDHDFHAHLAIAGQGRPRLNRPAWV